MKPRSQRRRCALHHVGDSSSGRAIFRPGRAAEVVGCELLTPRELMKGTKSQRRSRAQKGGPRDRLQKSFSIPFLVNRVSQSSYETSQQQVTGPRSIPSEPASQQACATGNVYQNPARPAITIRKVNSREEEKKSEKTYCSVRSIAKISASHV